MSAKPDRKPRIGRPPAGARVGEKVQDYPQLSLRLPPESKALLAAASQMTNRALWRIVADAIEEHVSRLRQADQRLIRELVERRRGDTRKPKPRIDRS
jgi:predicted DNA-binding protein